MSVTKSILRKRHVQRVSYVLMLRDEVCRIHAAGDGTSEPTVMRRRRVLFDLAETIEDLNDEPGVRCAALREAHLSNVTISVLMRDLWAHGGAVAVDFDHNRIRCSRCCRREDADGDEG